ncbi:NADH dehydrogenase subunit 2 (mitochondrion) [Mastacembelus armatus]|uniref:NADH-ubiquinone oxidoreductase chain 2 n=1 Tax=Mastacembelus armatus TaxID=205130 RepID=X2L629_9TELE|nr:NADH dehydrogenase subunit 2 [Mastacembelus armatus]AHN95386.1 NADH dehydrogenase subunit 2 [Mastacembelus armatus]
MSPFILSILLLGLGLGTTITFASSHWLLAWMGLENNTLAIIPLMAQHHHPRAAEATTKYFLTQATAAAMLLFATTSNAWLSGQWHILQMNHPLPTTLITLALALKIGLAPMHAWLPEVLQGLNLTTGLILSTWQKLAPFALLLQVQQTNPALTIMLGITSMLIGGWAGLNQTQLRKILAYSSIAHLGWMLIVIQFSPSLALLTLLLYFIMTSSAFLSFKLNNTTNINSLATSWAKMPTLTSLAPLILLSLAGLPPLTGFMPKWLIIQELTKQGLAPTATLAALSALLSLYFYLRLAYAMTLTISPNNLTGTTPWRLPSNQLTLPLAASVTATNFLLPLSPPILSLLTP